MMRRHAPASVFRDMTRELHLQESHSGYDAKLIAQVPDILCMGWSGTRASWVFACAWAQRVAAGSVREQLSFDYVRRMAAPLRLRWSYSPFFTKFQRPKDGWAC